MQSRRDCLTVNKTKRRDLKIRAVWVFVSIKIVPGNPDEFFNTVRFIQNGSIAL